MAALPLLWALLIAVTDLRQRRVPNLLLLLGLLPSLAWLCWRGHTPLGAEWFDALAGMFAGLFLALPGYLHSQLGAGDVKLAAVLGLMQGLHGVLVTLVLAGLLLGAASLFVLVRLGREQASAVTLPAGVALCTAFALSLTATYWLPL